MLFSFSLPLSLLVSLPLSFLLFFFLLFTTATATASISPITVNFCSWLIRCNRSLIKGPLPIEGKSTVQALCFESQTNRYYSISAFPIFYLSCRHGNQTGMRPSFLSTFFSIQSLFPSCISLWLTLPLNRVIFPYILLALTHGPVIQYVLNLSVKLFSEDGRGTLVFFSFYKISSSICNDAT